MRVKTGGMTSTKGKILLTPEIIAKRVETRKKVMRNERARVLFGLEQKTKLKVGLEPKAKQGQRRYLLSRGYVIDEKERAAYWTAETQRSFIIEARPRQWYDFKPIAEKQSN